MNNFLDNLAERAMSAEQDVRPRLPSLFEPAMPVSEPARQERGEPAGVESFDLTLEQEASDASPVKSFSPGHSSELKRESQSGGGNDRPLAVGQRLSPAHQVFQSDTHSLLVSDQLSEAAPGNGFEQASLKPAIAPLRPKPSSAVDRREAMAEEKVTRQIVNETSFRPALQPSPANGNGHREVEVRPPQVSSLIAPLVVRPKLDRYAEPPMPRPQPGAQTLPTPPGEQVINVTIGRIEVRATPPPAATSRSNNQKPPVMSLDDYLRQRSGRGGGV